LNDSLLTFTCCYSHPPAEVYWLEESCRRVGIELHRYGVGQNWPGFTGRLKGAADFLSSRTEDVVLFMDSADTFVLDNADVILEKFRSFNAPFVFGAEKNCWPDGSLSHHFPGNGTPWRFLNAGSWIGRREYTIDVLKDTLADYGTTWAEDDTRCFVQMMVDHGLPEKIDHNCLLFQSMYMHRDGEIDWSDFRNTVTNTYPSCWHFNGRTPGYVETYQKAIEVGRVKP